ncbi:MAG: tetratricopeptide repeat protein [Candidatus Obscuribacterales bacterium]|nr:tetratricopeptide repeat protein [Candidatus Obscuribacterales bacterium]
MTFRNLAAFLSAVFISCVFADSAKAENGAKAAEPAKKEASAEAEAAHHPDALAEANHEAINAFEHKKYEQARQLFEKVTLGLAKEPDSELSMAEVQENLGLVFKEEGKSKESEEAFAKSKDIRRKLHLPTLEPRMQELLPSSLYRKHMTELAKEISAIIDGHDPLFPTVKPAERSDENWAKLMRLAQQQKQSGELKAAFMTLRKALSIANTYTKPNDKVVTTMNMLAGTYRHLGRLFPARALYYECISEAEKMGKSESAGFATLLDNCSQVLSESHEYPEAEKMAERALVIYKKALGPESPDLAMSMCNLGEICLREKQDARGEKLIADSLQMMRKTVKPDDMRLLVLEDNLAGVYVDHKKFKEAEDLQKSLLERMEKNLSGKAHLDLSIALNNLAQTYCRQQKFAEAAPLFKRCVEMNREIFGDKDPKTKHAIGVYAATLERLGEKEEAAKFLKELKDAGN